MANNSEENFTWPWILWSGLHETSTQHEQFTFINLLTGFLIVLWLRTSLSVREQSCKTLCYFHLAAAHEPMNYLQSIGLQVFNRRIEEENICTKKRCHRNYKKASMSELGHYVQHVTLMLNTWDCNQSQILKIIEESKGQENAGMAMQKCLCSCQSQCAMHSWFITTCIAFFSLPASSPE